MIGIALFLFMVALTASLITRMYPKNWDKDLKFPTWIFGSVFWPIALPLLIFSLIINKVLDKFTKV